MSSSPDADYWRGRRVFLTGHTGFKGAWAALWLNRVGAEVHGFALPPDTEPSLWVEMGEGVLANETTADLADRDALSKAIDACRPQVVLHMAAQALVRAGYADPVGTIAANAMGTVYLLEALRKSSSLEIALVITTDKVYANDEGGRDFLESDPLGGHDPYSASKAAAEILTRSYAQSFFEGAGVKIATARAGNVIGGGDWSRDRLLPDVWRSARTGTPLKLRSPAATRPWQHVLDPIAGYFRYVEALSSADQVPRALNFGPPPGQVATVAEVVEQVGSALGLGTAWQQDAGDNPREMKFLSIDPSLARDSIGWRTRLALECTLEWTASWYAQHHCGRQARDLCLDQIGRYEALA